MSLLYSYLLLGTVEFLARVIQDISVCFHHFLPLNVIVTRVFMLKSCKDTTMVHNFVHFGADTD